MSMTNNYELYKVFYWAAKTGSLTQAAKALYLTQPSVSHAIKQLEERVGLTLFYRNAKGVSLTQEGKILFSYIEQSQILISLAEEKMEALKSLESGELRIGGSDSLFKHYLLPYLEDFHVRYPGIKLHLKHGTTPEVISYLKEGRIDLGVVRMPIVDAQLEVTESTELQDCFVMRRTLCGAERTDADDGRTDEISDHFVFAQQPGSNGDQRAVRKIRPRAEARH